MIESKTTPKYKLIALSDGANFTIMKDGDDYPFTFLQDCTRENAEKIVTALNAYEVLGNAR